jgi:hypothetical protein
MPADGRWDLTQRLMPADGRWDLTQRLKGKIMS